MSAHDDVTTRGRATGLTEPSTFVGRLREMSEVRRLLPRTRLLTLTGAGGVGKTRLGRRAARSLRGWFPGGVEFVDLAALEDGDLIESAVAGALGLRDTGRGVMPILVDHLADKRMLILLDNCEHLLQPCADLVGRLLRGAPRLRILATSRQTLGVAGEQILAVPTLAVPQADASVAAIARSEAVRLFAQRAADVRPGFTADAATAPALARLTQRLDGLPLALELAAVRLRTTPLDDLVRELDDSFDVTTGDGAPERDGARTSTAPLPRPSAARGSSDEAATLPRHQTLRATMDWSFGLCSPDERLLWSRLSIFPGGVDLETAEAVCSGEGIASEDVLELLSGLVDKSLLSSERRETGVRCRMLESLRAYGRERLPPGDEEALHRRYRDHYRRLAMRTRIDRLVPDQLGRYQTMQGELPNVRLALDLCFRPHGDAAAGLEIASMMWGYWMLAGALNEGRHWLDRGLELVQQEGTVRAMGLWADALLALYQDDLRAATPLMEECRALAERTGDDVALSFAIEASGLAALSAGRARHGFSLMSEARSRHRALGDVDAVGVNLYHSASLGGTESPARAAALGAELLALTETHRAPLFRAYALLQLGYAAWRTGDAPRTEARMREAATVMGIISDRWGLVQCLETLAWTAGAAGRHERAARLMGAADRVEQTLDVRPIGLKYLAHAHRDCDAEARRSLGSRAFTSAFRAGTRLGLDRAVAYALEGQGA